MPKSTMGAYKKRWLAEKANGDGPPGTQCDPNGSKGKRPPAPEAQEKKPPSRESNCGHTSEARGGVCRVEYGALLLALDTIPLPAGPVNRLIQEPQHTTPFASATFPTC